MQKEGESSKTSVIFSATWDHWERLALNERVLQLQPHYKLQELWQICIQEMLWMNALGTGVGGKRQEICLFPSDKKLQIYQVYWLEADREGRKKKKPTTKS